MFKTALIFFGLGLFFVGCGSMSIVNKPEAEKVKTVAIVSIFSNKVIYNRSPSSGGMLGGLMALKTLATEGTQAYEKLEMKDGKILRIGLEKFESEFAKVKGWQMVPHAKVVASGAYKNFLKRAPASTTVKEGMISKTVQLNEEFVTFAGMTPFEIGYDSKPEVKAQLRKLAEELNVDAVAVIKLDVAYAPHTAVGGVGSAAAAVGADVKIVNKWGEFVVATPERKKGSEIYETSDDTVALAGSLAYSKELEKLIADAIGKTAGYYADEINKNL